MKKIITLPCFNIEVMIDGKGGGTITSELSDLDKNSKEYPPFSDSPYYTSYVFATTMESLILAHAIAGVNIEHLAYIAGIETAMNVFLHH